MTRLGREWTPAPLDIQPWNERSREKTNKTGTRCRVKRRRGVRRKVEITSAFAQLDTATEQRFPLNLRGAPLYHDAAVMFE